MKTPLCDLHILSIYRVSGQRVLLPKRMARCTPDAKRAILAILADVEAAGGHLYLSDLFRSHDMQFQAYLDWKTGKKKAYSPPPGGSLHEAGRAFDLDLGALKVKLDAFWEIAARHGVVPIIPSPNPRASEAWHFERRGSHQLVHDYYQAGKGTNFASPYRALAASAILAVGEPLDLFAGRDDAAYVQSALIRLGQEIGNIDGQIGPKSRKGLAALGVPDGPLPEVIAGLDTLLQARFPEEFYDKTPLDATDPFDTVPPAALVA
jgi:D-alanyl-D-alanine dipeptidase